MVGITANQKNLLHFTLKYRNREQKREIPLAPITYVLTSSTYKLSPKLLNTFTLLLKRCVNYSIFHPLKRWKSAVNEMLIFSLLSVIIYY